MEDYNRLLRLSAQVALLGEVTPQLFALTCGIEGNTIKVIGYFSGPVSEADHERIQCVGTEIIADFPSPFMIEEKTYSLTEHSMDMLDFWAFMRAK